MSGSFAFDAFDKFQSGASHYHYGDDASDALLLRTRVIHQSQARADWQTDAAFVNIMSGSVWEARFEISETKETQKRINRAAMINQYAQEIQNDVLKQKLIQTLLRGKTLVCSCKPKACHGDVLACFADQQLWVPLCEQDLEMSIATAFSAQQTSTTRKTAQQQPGWQININSLEEQKIQQTKRTETPARPTSSAVQRQESKGTESKGKESKGKETSSNNLAAREREGKEADRQEKDKKQDDKADIEDDDDEADQEQQGVKQQDDAAASPPPPPPLCGKRKLGLFLADESSVDAPPDQSKLSTFFPLVPKGGASASSLLVSGSSGLQRPDSGILFVASSTGASNDNNQPNTIHDDFGDDEVQVYEPPLKKAKTTDVPPGMKMAEKTDKDKQTETKVETKRETKGGKAACEHDEHGEHGIHPMPPALVSIVMGDLRTLDGFDAIVQQCNIETRFGHGLSADLAACFTYANVYGFCHAPQLIHKTTGIAVKNRTSTPSKLGSVYCCHPPGIAGSGLVGAASGQSSGQSSAAAVLSGRASAEYQKALKSTNAFLDLSDFDLDSTFKPADWLSALGQDKASLGSGFGSGFGSGASSGSGSGSGTIGSFFGATATITSAAISTDAAATAATPTATSTAATATATATTTTAAKGGTSTLLALKQAGPPTPKPYTKTKTTTRTMLPSVVCMFAQTHPGKPTGPSGDDSAATRFGWFRVCLRRIYRILQYDPIGKTWNSIAFPWTIGCGLAQGEWMQYEKEIVQFSAAVQQGIRPVRVFLVMI